MPSVHIGLCHSCQQRAEPLASGGDGGGSGSDSDDLLVVKRRVLPGEAIDSGDDGDGTGAGGGEAAERARRKKVRSHARTCCSAIYPNTVQLYYYEVCLYHWLCIVRVVVAVRERACYALVLAQSAPLARG
jgi:hypothetical protein